MIVTKRLSCLKEVKRDLKRVKLIDILKGGKEEQENLERDMGKTLKG